MSEREGTVDTRGADAALLTDLLQSLDLAESLLADLESALRLVLPSSSFHQLDVVKNRRADLSRLKERARERLK